MYMCVLLYNIALCQRNTPCALAGRISSTTTMYGHQCNGGQLWQPSYIAMPCKEWSYAGFNYIYTWSISTKMDHRAQSGLKSYIASIAWLVYVWDVPARGPCVFIRHMARGLVRPMRKPTMQYKLYYTTKRHLSNPPTFQLLSTSLISLPTSLILLSTSSSALFTLLPLPCHVIRNAAF